MMLFCLGNVLSLGLYLKLANRQLARNDEDAEDILSAATAKDIPEPSEAADKDVDRDE